MLNNMLNIFDTRRGQTQFRPVTCYLLSSLSSNISLISPHNEVRWKSGLHLLSSHRHCYQQRLM